jgi:UDP-N-acetylglucosamine 2-epimerase (non-hydrolysing)
MGEMLIKLDKIATQKGLDLMLVEGDTNSNLAAALAGLKKGVRIGHVEAGLRSFDWRMPEEHNRRIVDHISDLLFAPTETAKRNLLDEKVHGETFVTGNTVIDAVAQHLPIAEKRSKIMQRVKAEDFILATAHRAENVDDPKVLKGFVEVFTEASLPVVFPAHPRTVNRLKEFSLYEWIASSKNVQLLPPLGYFDFLVLMKNCKLIITDSGGLQEEATAPQMRKPVLVLRLSTERPEAVEAGYVTVTGTVKDIIQKNLKRLIDDWPRLTAPSPYGKGDAGKKIVELTLNNL